MGLSKTTRWDPQEFYVHTSGMASTIAKQAQVALSSGEAEFDAMVRAAAMSRQPSKILQQVGMKVWVTVASDSSAARGICARNQLGEYQTQVDRTAVGARPFAKKKLELTSKETLKICADIATTAHTTDRRC